MDRDDIADNLSREWDNPEVGSPLEVSKDLVNLAIEVYS